MSDLTTFRSLDEAAGRRVFAPEELLREFSLEIWFAEMYTLPIAEFTFFDLERSCRQDKALADYLPAVFQRCVSELTQDPLADDGDLLSAVIKLPQHFWTTDSLRKPMLAIVEAAFDQTEDRRLQEEILCFVAVFDDGGNGG